MTQILILMSTLLVLISPVVYIRSILEGKTKPHRTTRFVLLVITALTTWSLLDSHYSAGFWLALASTLQALVVFALSLKRGYGGWSRLDLICLAIAAIGIMVWQVSGHPIIGLYASILADYIGCVPTFVKTYKLPFTEIKLFYAMDTVAGILSLAALNTYTAYTLSYPIYIVLVNFATFVLIVWRQWAEKGVEYN